MDKNWYQIYRDELLDSAGFKYYMDKQYTTVRHFEWGRVFSEKTMLFGLGLGIAFCFSALFASSEVIWAKITGIIGIISCIIAIIYGPLHMQHKIEEEAAAKIFRYICYEAAVKEYIHDKERSKTIDLLRKTVYAEDLNELRDELDNLLDELYENLGYELPRDYEVREKVRTLLKLEEL